MKLFLLLLLNLSCIDKPHNQSYHLIQINLEISAKRKITSVKVEGSDSAMVNIIKTGFSNFVFPKKRPPKGNYVIKVQYITAKDSTIADVKCLSSVGYGLEQQAMRLVKKGSRWTPAPKGGSVVRPYRRLNGTVDSL